MAKIEPKRRHYSPEFRHLKFAMPQVTSATSSDFEKNFRGNVHKVTRYSSQDMRCSGVNLLFMICSHLPGRLIHRTSSNGLRTCTPVGAKCLTFRVTTVKPWLSAVAAINRSAPSFPSFAESLPQSLAEFADTGKTRSAYRLRRISSHCSNSAANATLDLRAPSIPRSISPTPTTLMNKLSAFCALIH